MSKRLANHAVDWIKFAEFIPAEQKAAYQAFRQQSDQYVKSVSSNPDALPSIDFAAYKSRAPALQSAIEQFEKQYASVNIPFPSDKQNLSSKIDADKKAAVEKQVKFVQASNQRVEENKVSLSKWDFIPPFEHMTQDEWAIYFPDKNIMPDPYKKPTYWPHDDKEINSEETYEAFRDYKVRTTDPEAH